MKKRAQVIKLPTSGNNIPAIRYADNLKYQVCNSDYTANQLQTAGFDVFHLYIVTDDEIKEGDYCIEEIGESVFGPYSKDDVIQNPKKIIATTDPDLVTKEVEVYEVQAQKMEGHYHKELPSPSKSFIESYCKNPVEKVMVEYETPVSPLKMRRSNSGKARMLAIKQAAFGLQPKLTHNNELIIHPIEKKMYTREEVAELCAKAYWDGNLNTGDIIPENWIKENL